MTLQDNHDSLGYPFDKRADAIASLLLSHSRECRDSLKPLAFRLCPGSRETREDLELGRGKSLMNFRGTTMQYGKDYIKPNPFLIVSDPDPLPFMPFMSSMNFMKRVKFLSIKNEGGTP